MKINSTTMLMSCKINYLCCYGLAAFRPKKKNLKNIHLKQKPTHTRFTFLLFIL